VALEVFELAIIGTDDGERRFETESQSRGHLYVPVARLLTMTMDSNGVSTTNRSGEGSDSKAIARRVAVWKSNRATETEFTGQALKERAARFT
jgi:hypothetical protein